MELLSGEKGKYGDLSYKICPLPNVPILFVYHQSDEEFPSELNVLFDRNVINYLPPELIWGMIHRIVNRISVLFRYKEY